MIDLPTQFAVQLSVEHADAQSLIRIGFWD